MFHSLAGGIGVAGRRGAEQPRPLGAEGHDRDDGVVEPAHVGVPVECLAVVAVAILDHRETLEGGVVTMSQVTMDLGQQRVRRRPPRLPA